MINKPPEPSEFDQQCAVFRFAELMSNLYPELELLVGSLNGVRLTIGQAVKAKKAGMKKGYPDIRLDVARGPYHGLRIELKRQKGGVVSPEQKEWLRRLSEQGYYTVVCYGEDEAKAILMRYVSGGSIFTD